MSGFKHSVPSAAKPVLGDHFDAWNSGSTGHQRAENRLGGSTGWRDSRTLKLSHQFKSRGTGGERISDRVGAGSEDWNEELKALIPKDVRERAERSVAHLLTSRPGASVGHVLTSQARKAISPRHGIEASQTAALESQEKVTLNDGRIFTGLVFYINGSTYPHISDHKLKRLLVENGAELSIHLGRRRVTHVVVGRPCVPTTPTSTTRGSGGGLAAKKLQKEITRIGGCGVKYIDVEWVIKSIENGRRLPEAPFSKLKVATKNQQSVLEMLRDDQSAT